MCGLKWSPDNQYLASGGNDNRLYVWNMQSLSPVQTYTDHLAAVKAIAWSPHHHGLLASGGGTADRCIRFWNTLTGQPMQCVDTGTSTQLIPLTSINCPDLLQDHKCATWRGPNTARSWCPRTATPKTRSSSGNTQASPK